jgi:signal transduction histidine kinase
MGAARVSLRARIAVAAVAAVALGGIVAGIVLVREVERDGRDALDAQLVERADRLARAPRERFGPGRFRGGPGPAGPGGPALLAGSDTFVQVAVDGQVVDRTGDVPADPPEIPATAGLATVSIGGERWRSLTIGNGPRATQLQILSRLVPVEERVASIRTLVVLIGLVALALTGAAAWMFTSVAIRPLERLREGAARITGADDLGRPLPDDDGPDEVRSLAVSLNEMLGRVERAVGATRRFAADAGHELRTPLTGLRANLDTLERNADLDPAQREAAIAEMSAELDRIVHLLDGLQALARGDATATLPVEPVELPDLLDAAVYAARRRHPDAAFDLRTRDEATIEGWPEGVRLLVDNLLDNAALHGGRAVRVTLDGATITVEDDGPGIPPDQRAALVEPFARGDGASAPGTGLGLAIVAQQAALHGGTLTLGEAAAGGLAATVALRAGRPNLVMA